MSRWFLLSALCLLVAAALVTFFWPGGGFWQHGEQLAIAQARAAIQSSLRDSGSALFYDEVVLGSPTKPRTVCGNGNAKNGFGGYAGRSAFIYEQQTGRARIASNSDEVFAIDQSCRLAKLNDLSLNKFAVSSNFALYTFTFSMPTNDSNAALNFNIGDVAGQVYIDNVNVSVGATPPPAPAPAPSPALQTIRPTTISGVIKNPGIGYQTFYTSAASDAQIPSGNMYTRFNWSQVESSPGAYNFSVIDNAIASAKAAGQKLAFRIMGFEEGNYGPVGLRNAGYPGYTFGFEGMSGVYFPDMDQSIVQQDMRSLITALGQRYGNNNDIDSIDLGFIGAWGEYHFWSTSPTVPMPNTAALNFHTDSFANFRVPIVTGGGLENSNPTAFNYAMQKNAGWRVDCWGNYDSGWNHMNDSYPAILAAAPNAWQKGPVILEPCGVMSDWVAKNYPWQQALQWAIDNHASEFSNKSAPIPSVMMTAVRDMTAKLGYRFVLTQAQFAMSTVQGHSFSLSLDWSNIGNAPMYFDRVLVVKVGSLITSTTLTMKGFLPGSRADVATVATTGLAAGTYPVSIGLAPIGSQSPDINLAISGTGPWYILGNITISP
jgi:hypothetical protein